MINSIGSPRSDSLQNPGAKHSLTFPESAVMIAGVDSVAGQENRRARSRYSLDALAAHSFFSVPSVTTEMREERKGGERSVAADREALIPLFDSPLEN